MKKYLFTVLTLAVFAVCFVASDDSDSVASDNSDSSDINSSRLTGSKDVEYIQSKIAGTTWTYTETYGNPIGLWYKLTFDNKTCKVYYARPKDGQWTFSFESPYYVEEKRLDDGKRYVFVYLKYNGNKEEPLFPIGINITQGVFIHGASGAIGYMSESDYTWD